MGLLTIQRGGPAADPGLCEGRLTLAAGYPVYRPEELTPSSTDTTNEILTFATPHFWATGTKITPFTTGGGLTAGTVYFVNAASTTTIKLYDTLANATTGGATGLINLTASITSVLVPVGIDMTLAPFFSPYNGNRIALYDGTRWGVYEFAETLRGGTAIAGSAYDCWGRLSAGTLGIDITAWTSPTVRATELALQDGVLVKSGDATRRYLGSFYCRTTDSVVEETWDCAVTGAALSRDVYNHYNQVPLDMRITETTSHTYNSTTPRSWNGTLLPMALMLGAPQSVMGSIMLVSNADTAGRVPSAGFGIDVTNAFYPMPMGLTTIRVTNAINQPQRMGVAFQYPVARGLHSFNILEAASAGVTSTLTQVAGAVRSQG